MIILGISTAVLILTVALINASDTDYSVPTTKVINTEYGKVRGKLDTTLFDNRLFYAFKGIPYAQPPIGDLRFKVISEHISFLFESKITYYRFKWIKTKTVSYIFNSVYLKQILFL